jgi:hypothetical protein
VYLAGLLLEREQLVDGGLWVALIMVNSTQASAGALLTDPSFSASGRILSTSFEKSLSALSTSPLDMVAGLWWRFWVGFPGCTC